jgi:hypothetical protein
MDDFEIPTMENRLLVRHGRLFQVNIDWSRDARQKKQKFKMSERAQRELKRVVAVMLTEDDDNVVVTGTHFAVSMRKFDGAVIRDTFEFSRKKRKLDVSPWVYRFSVTPIDKDQ